MSNFFYSDISKVQSISWEDLLVDLASTTSYSKYCFEADYYEIFKRIIVSALIGKEIVLLDSDFTEREVESLTGEPFSRITNPINYEIIKIEVSSKEELISRVLSVKDPWSLTLFTSGTTGQPRKVTHSFESITRNVKIKDHMSFNVWGFAYSATHMAGIQVFFQALLNGNHIVRIFNLSKAEIYESIDAINITHISATPTFLRMLLPEKAIHPSVCVVTSGGEKYDSNLADSLKTVFPNASYKNIYASTEAGSLLASDGNHFRIPQKWINLIKIQDDELIIHKTLLGDPNITAGDWYLTGDVVRYLDKEAGLFEFISRKNEMINIGGYKVNPVEVEQELRVIDGITQSRVYAKRNSVLGNILCCEIMVSQSYVDETYVRNQLARTLQEYKIPRIVKITDMISVGRTGKTSRL